MLHIRWGVNLNLNLIYSNQFNSFAPALRKVALWAICDIPDRPFQAFGASEFVTPRSWTKQNSQISRHVCFLDWDWKVRGQFFSPCRENVYYNRKRNHFDFTVLNFIADYYFPSNYCMPLTITHPPLAINTFPFLLCISFQQPAAMRCVQSSALSKYHWKHVYTSEWMSR